MENYDKMKKWNRTILIINLNNDETENMNIDSNLFRCYLGGRSLGSYLLYRRSTAGVDALDQRNPLIFSTGPLTGTNFPGSAKAFLTTKSPLTGIILTTVSGGNFGPELKRTGFDALVIEGKASDPKYLYICNGEAELRDASTLHGMLVSDAQEAIRRELKTDKVHIACIGPAGENLVPYASIIDGRRAFGRGGAGAVMGSKNLKAIVVQGEHKTKIKYPDKFKDSVKKAIDELKKNPVTSEAYPKYGTTATVDLTSESGILPIKNWQEAYATEASGLFSEVIREGFHLKDLPCAPGCPVRCSKMNIVRRGKWKGALSEGPEYETIYALGACCGIFNPDFVIQADALCDDYGLDTISTGVSIAFGMECFEKGLLSKEDTRGLELRFGSEEIAIRLIREIANRTGFGETLSAGVKEMSRRIGHGSERFAMHVKGMEMGGYDPRGAKGMSLVYACGPRGGCHHAGGYTVIDELMDPSIDRFEEKGKASLAFSIRNKFVAACDSASICYFVGAFLSDTVISDAIFACTGLQLNSQDLQQIGERASCVERAFNVREGVRRKDDTLPERLLKESVPHGPTKDQVVDLLPMIDEFYKISDWNLETGIPSAAKLHALDLEWIIEDLQMRGVPIC